MQCITAKHIFNLLKNKILTNKEIKRKIKNKEGKIKKYQKYQLDELLPPALITVSYFSWGRDISVTSRNDESSNS